MLYSTLCSGEDQRKHQSSASLAFVRGIHRSPVNSSHKGPVTRKMFPFDDVMLWYDVPVFARFWISLYSHDRSIRWVGAKRRNSSALTMKLRPSCTKPSNWPLTLVYFLWSTHWIRKSKDYVYGIWLYKVLGLWEGYYWVKKWLVSCMKPWTKARNNNTYMKSHSIIPNLHTNSRFKMWAEKRTIMQEASSSSTAPNAARRISC